MNTSVNTINTLRDLSAAITPAKSATKSVSNDTESPRFSDALEIINKQNVTYSPTKTNPPSREEVVNKKLAELRRIHEEFDYSKLSCTAEAYAVIEKRFEEAFPDEFEISRSFGYLTRGLPEYCAISKEFIKEASRYYDSTIEERNKYRGYDGLSYEEIESVICEKYAGKETLRDQLNLLGELTEAGVINHNCMKNSVYLGPVFDVKIAVGLTDKYNLYDMSGNIDRNAFDMAMAGEKFSIDELFAFTADLSFEMPDLFDVFEKIFESIDERAIENKRQEYRENAIQENNTQIENLSTDYDLFGEIN
jgi:hypothetical protein